jgi:hypothetical protein
MAKSQNAIEQLKNAVKAKQAASKAKGTPSKAEAKLSKGLKAHARALGERIVKTAIEAHKTTLEILTECKGKSALELAEIKLAVSDAWKAYAESLTARATHSTRDEVDAMRRQSIYNRNSEMQAVLSAYEKYSKIADKKAKKEFDARHDEQRGYHALVLFCRHFNRGSKPTRDSNKSGPAARERKAWQKKKSERIAKAKQFLRFATLDALMIISEYIDKRIAQEKRSLVQKGEGKSAVVKALRKTA